MIVAWGRCRSHLFRRRGVARYLVDATLNRNHERDDEKARAGAWYIIWYEKRGDGSGDHG